MHILKPSVVILFCLGAFWLMGFMLGQKLEHDRMQIRMIFAAETGYHAGKIGASREELLASMKGSLNP